MAESSEKGQTKPHPITLAMAAMCAAAALGLLVYQYNTLYPSPERNRRHIRGPRHLQTKDGLELLWASGPRNLEEGEWFDITHSPLNPDGYQHGLGKDSIPAIDAPRFVPIGNKRQLEESGLTDATIVIGYSHNGQTKAYPIHILDRHELVNDNIGGKPVTVGW